MPVCQPGRGVPATCVRAVCSRVCSCRPTAQLLLHEGSRRPTTALLGTAAAPHLQPGLQRGSTSGDSGSWASTGEVRIPELYAGNKPAAPVTDALQLGDREHAGLAATELDLGHISCRQVDQGPRGGQRKGFRKIGTASKRGRELIRDGLVLLHCCHSGRWYRVGPSRYEELQESARIANPPVYADGSVFESGAWGLLSAGNHLAAGCWLLLPSERRKA